MRLYISITLHNRSTAQNLSFLPQANKAFCTFIVRKIPGGLSHNHYHRNPFFESRAVPPVDLSDQPFDPIPLDCRPYASAYTYTNTPPTTSSDHIKYKRVRARPFSFPKKMLELAGRANTFCSGKRLIMYHLVHRQATSTRRDVCVLYGVSC